MTFDRSFYDKGFHAGEKGEKLDSCPYRLNRKRHAWLAGYHAGKVAEEARHATHDIHRTDKQIESSLKWIEKLKGKHCQREEEHN